MSYQMSGNRSPLIIELYKKDEEVPFSHGDLKGKNFTSDI